MPMSVDIYAVATYRPPEVLAFEHADLATFDAALAWLDERLTADRNLVGRLFTNATLGSDQRAQLAKWSVEAECWVGSAAGPRAQQS